MMIEWLKIKNYHPIWMIIFYFKVNRIVFIYSHIIECRRLFVSYVIRYPKIDHVFHE